MSLSEETGIFIVGDFPLHGDLRYFSFFLWFIPWRLVRFTGYFFIIIVTSRFPAKQWKWNFRIITVKGLFSHKLISNFFQSLMYMCQSHTWYHMVLNPLILKTAKSSLTIMGESFRQKLSWEKVFKGVILVKTLPTTLHQNAKSFSISKLLSQVS